jgi:hypothetical protein
VADANAHLNPKAEALLAAAGAFDVGAPRAVAFAGESLQLYGGRALHWPAADALLIADLHLGKGEVFRRAGLAVPRGGTRDDLVRLSALLAATGASRLLILGDVLHGALHDAAGWREDWAGFRAAHASLHVEAIAGNHDRALRAAGAGGDRDGSGALGLALREDGARERGLVLCHEPDRAPSGTPSLCGHWHPAARVPGLGRLPAFWWRAAAVQLVLPAFSGFTGRVAPRIAPDDALYACACHAVLPPLRT